MVRNEPNIYEYFDYQKFLLDYYQWRKGRDSYFSYRYISGKIKIDHGLLIKIFQGQRHITVKSIPKFAGLLDLGKRKSVHSAPSSGRVHRTIACTSPYR